MVLAIPSISHGFFHSCDGLTSYSDYSYAGASSMKLQFYMIFMHVSPYHCPSQPVAVLAVWAESVQCMCIDIKYHKLVFPAIADYDMLFNILLYCLTHQTMIHPCPKKAACFCKVQRVKVSTPEVGQCSPSIRFPLVCF